MKSYVSSFSGSWFQRCLSMLLCFCMMLSLCPIPQHAAASEVGEGQEVSQPVETQPAPQPVETQPAPQPVETQPAPQPVETQPAPQPEETQPVTVPEQTQPVTEPEQTQPVTVPEETQEVTQPVETQEVTEPEETQEVTEPEETQETTEPEETQGEQPLVVTSWQWVDEEEYIDPIKNELLITFASIENPVYLWSILEVLPTALYATVDGEVVELPLGEWKCDDYPTAGAYQGEYVFKTTLPEGYVLAEDAAALEVPVVFYSDASTLEEEHTHSFDASGVCSCGAMQVRYLDASHAVQTAVCQAVTAETTELTDGWYVAQGNVTIGGSVTVTESSSLILADGCSLTVGGDFLIQGGKSLNIYVQSGGTGSLTISGSTGLDISGSGDVSVGIYGGRIVVNASIGSEEWRMTLSSSAGSSAVIYCGGFGGNVDYYNGFCGVIVVQEYQKIWVYDRCTLCFDIVVPQGSKYMEVDEASLTFTNGAKLQVPEGSSLRLYGPGSFPNGIAANVDLRTILGNYCAFQDSSGSIIKLSGETSLSGSITLVDKHYCSWRYKDSTAEGHTRYCDECGRTFTEAHSGDAEAGMVTTDDTHSYTCDCGAEVTEAHQWEYFYSDANQHEKYCPVCGKSEDIPHDFTSGDCVCGAVQVSYADATGAEQGTAGCLRLSDLEPNEYGQFELGSGWYLVDSTESGSIYAYLREDDEINLILGNGCNATLEGCSVIGGSLTIWQQQGENVGRLTVSDSYTAISCSRVTINGGVLELSGDYKAFQGVPTIGSCMKLSVKGETGEYTAVNIDERTSQLSTATKLKLEPCTSHAFGSDTEYIDSSYHGIRCQDCGIGGEGMEKHTFDDNGFCTCGAVKFLDENGKDAVQLCQKVTAEGNITDGWYVVKGTVNYSGTISGDVNLVLADGCSLNAAGALTLANDTRLTVYAQSKDNDKMGKLIATNPNGHYGIGSDEGSQLFVTGGSIKATGLSYGIYSSLTITGGRVEAISDPDGTGDATYWEPKISVGMRVVNGEDNTPVSDFATRLNHVIIEPCKDHTVTKGDSYIDANTHDLVCAYCNLTVEGTAEHSFNEKGICSCGAVQYLDENGETNIQLCQVISSGTNLQENDWYVWDGQDENDLYVYGDSNLILTEGSTLTAEAYLHENSLTVYGQPGSCLTLSYIYSDGTLNILGGSTVIDSTYYVDNLSLNVNGGILVVKQVGETTLTVNNQRGIYLNSGVGHVAGDFTLSQSFTLEDEQILTIPTGAKLTVASQNTRAAASYLENYGTIYVDGALSGDVSGSGEVYYLVKLPENVTATLEDGSDLETYESKLYAKEGQKIVLTGGTSESYLANGSCVYGATFTMGAEVTEVEVHSHSFNNNDGFCSSCDAYQEPNRDASGVYEIDNAGQLFWFAGLVNGTLNGVPQDRDANGKLTADITIPKKKDGTDRKWTPIGDDANYYSNYYYGTFDGADHTVSNLRIVSSDGITAGLFGHSSGTIQNVKLVNASGDKYNGIIAGGICGQNNEGGAIKNCSVASVSWTNCVGGYLGSVCGLNYGEIENCTSTGSTMQYEGANSSEDLYLCGNSGGALSGCTSDSGICSIIYNGTVSDCCSSGTYFSVSISGSATVKNCYTTGSEFAYYIKSGATVENCYTTGSKFAVSIDSNANITNCYYQASSETDSFDGTTFKTADQFKSGEVAYLLNANRSPLIWIQNLSGDSYPRLGSEEQYQVYKTDYCPTYSNDEYNTNPHSKPNDGTTVCPVCGAQFVASVTVGDVTSYYTTFQGASYAAVSLYNDSTVTLLADVATDYFPDINVIFNLNLNGKTLNVNNAKIYVYEYAVLNVQGTGTLNLQAGNKLHVEGGTVNIQGGAIDGDIQVYNSKEISGNLSISGGSLIGHIVVNGSVLNISGGSVKGNITLNDGKYYAESSDEPWPLYSTLQISGGKFEGNIEDTSEFTEFNITGGEFVDLSSNKMLRELLNDGYWFYTSRTGGEGSYTYSGLVKYSKLDTASYTGTLYVGPHDHSYTYTTITDTEHKGTCGCGKADNGQHKFENGFCTSCDTYQKPEQDASGVYQIANAGNLFWFAAKVNGGSRSISGKLVCEDTITIPEGRTWTPIGNSDKNFAGKFDGDGKTISGLNINASSMFYVGLFGYVGAGGSVSNLTVANSNFYGKNSVGGICGYNKGTITGCTSSANVSGTQSVGGICGNLAGGNIMNCSNSGTVNGSIFVGGICGNNSSSVTNCFNIGTVTTGNYAGSIYGSDNNGNGTASNCYYLAASETDNGDGTFGKTEAQFKSGEVAYLLNANRTPTVWGQTIGSQDYPVLNGDAVYRALKCDNATVAYYINGTEDITLGHEDPDENGNCPVCHQAIVASVTDIQGTATYYTSLEDASKVADDAEGSTLKLLSNVTTIYFSMPVYGKFTLDLNGKSLDLGNFDVNVYNDLTITGGEGSALKVKALQLSDGSTLNIQGGSITGNITGDSSANSVNLNISGGSITGTVETTNATCNISGGSLSNGVKATGGALTITGGSITGKVENYNGATLSVTGGEFTELSHNGPLYSLPDDGYWFYDKRNVDEEGNVTYETPVSFEDMGTTGENGNAVAGPVYVGPHSHDFVFTSIDEEYHDCECTGCQRKYFDGHTDANSDGLCDVCGTIEVHYKDVDGRDRTQRCFPITADTKELTTSPLAWYVVKDAGLLVGNRITVNGSVNLILMDEMSLTVNGGIEVGSGKSLTIYAQSTDDQMGSLNATGKAWEAGIGGGGSITINGGTVTATGGTRGAGIGGGSGATGGNITINGGTVTATGGYAAAGIGGGLGATGGNITINGGTVTATGGTRAAGIGGGYGETSNGGNGGTVTINGGTVTATGDSYAAGIGGGAGGIDAGQYTGGAGAVVKINGGTVRATGGYSVVTGYAPGIGGGVGNTQGGAGGSLTVTGGYVVATGIGGAASNVGNDPGANGSFMASGNGVVITDNIKDQTQIGSWNGIVFIANEGKVYGDVALSSDLVIPAGKNMTLDMNAGTLELDGAKISLGEGSSLKLSGNGSFPSGVTVSGGYLLDILADGWAFFGDESGNTIIPLSATQYTTFPETDDDPQVYLRQHTHSWSYSNITEETHDKTCTCVSGVLTEAHTKGSDGFCTLCGAGVARYVDANGKDMGEKACFAITNSSTTWGEDGKTTWYVVKDKEVNISDRINVTGNVNLILADGCQLKANSGIHVASGTSLTIWAQSTGESMGKLTATTTVNWRGSNAAIGGNNSENSGTITIHGGNINATSHQKGAAIGGGEYAEGNIHIYGGYVTAEARKSSAAIGGGNSGDGGTIEITGGTITAICSAANGSGIGSGGNSDAGTITISGGTVVAHGGTSGTGIGAYKNYSGGSVTITGGNVTAQGGREGDYYTLAGCGIEAGSITINGGEVTAIGGAGSGYPDAAAFSCDPNVSDYESMLLSTGTSEDDLTNVTYSDRTADGYDGYTASKAVRIEPCGTEENPHNRVCKDVGDGIWHNSICNWCGYVEDAQAHTVPGEDGRCTACDALIVASMTANGSTGYYSEFLPAFSAANGLEGSTLKLLAKVYAERMLKVTGSFTLDLNGKTLESDYFEYGNQYGDMWNDEGAIYVYGGSLTIQDSSEGKTGKIFLEPNPDLGDDFKNAISVRGGTLNFFGGKVNYRIRNELGTLNISGTAVVEVGSDDTAVRNINYQYSYQKAHATISGGTLIGGDCISAEGYTEVAITGGTFEALAGDYKSCVYCDSDSSVTVSGGTFTKQQGDKVYTFRGNNISVSGGEFIDGISVFGGNLKDRLATDENGEIAYWYYQSLDNGVYSDGITAADAAAASYGSTVYVGSHSHAYSSEDGTCVCGKQIPVAVSIGGETQFFDSLSAAMASLDTSAEEKAQVTVFQSTSFQNDLVIPENVTLTVKDGATLTAENNARLFVRSSLSGSVSGDVRYLVSVNTNEVNVTGRSVTVYLGSVYARADDPINLKAINYDADSMMLTDWLVDNVSSSESFTMPSHPVTIERKLEAIVATVTILGNTTPYTNLYSAFDAANETNDNVIIELKADVVLGNDSPAMLTGGNVIFRGWEHTISGPETEADWEHRNGYIGVLSGANLTIESGTIDSSAFLHCGSGSSVTVTNGSIDTLIVEGGKLTVENASDEENNPVGNIRVENLEVMGFSVGDVQLKGGSYGTITVPGGKYVSDLLAEGYAYKLTDGSWEDANNGTYTEAISAATVLPVPVTITAQPDATNTMTYGDVESLSVTANPEESSYQWYEVIPDTSETPQTKAITGETGSTLKLSTFDAGTHEFFCEATVDGYNAKSSSATVTVNPRTLDIQWDDDTFQYDGQYHPKFTIENTANGDQVIPVISPNNDTQKDVGNYTVGVVDFVANGTDGLNKHGNYKLGETTYQDFSITAKPITVNITANGGTYGGAITGATAELVGVVAGETVPVTLTYTSDSGDNSTTAPTDAGTYTVTATIKNRNYQLTGTTTAEFVVQKATNSWTTEPSVANWTYGDANTVQPGAAKYGTVKVEYKVKDADDSTYIATAPTKAGSYKVRFTVEETSNYTGLSEEIAFTIGRRNLHIIFADNDSKGRVYNGTDKVELYNFTFEEGDVVSGDTVGIDMGDNGLIGTLSSKNVGTYTQVTLPNDLSLTDNGDGSAKNYNLVQPTGPVATNLTISPKKVTFSGITAKDKDYNATTAVTLDYNGLKITDRIPDDDLFVSVTAAFEDANAGQNKTVAFTNPVLTGNSAGNYVLKETGNQTSTTATIYPLEISIVDVTVDDKVYDGTKDAPIMNFGRLSTNYDGDKLTIVPGTASFETANAGNGKTVSFQGFELSGSAKDNYKLIGQPASTTANITPATVATLTLKASSATYDGSAQVPQIDKVTSENGLTVSDYQVSYQDADGNTVTELKNAGEYTVKVEGKGNFQGTATADFTIEKANAATGTAPKANSLTYNGQAQELVTAGTTTDGTMVYSTSEDGEYTTTIPTGKDAGGYEVWYMVQGDSNHLSSAPVKLTPSIAQKSIAGATITLDAVLTYNGEEQEQSVESVKIDGLDVTYTVSKNTGTNAGPYKLTVTGNGNFTGTKDMAWSIAKKSIADAEITLGDELTYNGKLQTQSIASVKVGGLEVTYTVSKNTGTNAGEYTLTVTANGNFIGTKDMAWSIAKKSIADAEITLGAQLTYNGNPQRQSITSVKIDGLNVTYDASGVENTNAGSYTLTVTGNGNFQGEATASYSIAKAKPTVTPATLTITYGTKLSGCDLSGFKASFGGKELPGSFAFDQPETMPHVSDSGATSYKLTFTPEDTVNFEKVPLETKVTVNKKELTVDVAVQDKQYNGTSEALFDGTPALVGVVTGDKVELTYGNPYFTDVAEKKDIAISFTEAFGIQGDDSGNYYLTQPTGITASIYNSFTAAKGEDGSYTVSTNEWTNQDFVVTAQEGLQLSLTNTADGSWFDTLTVTTEGEADLKFYVRSADGAISKQASEHYKLDKTAPTGSIFFDGTDQMALTPVVLYRNVAVNAEITGSDDRSGVKDLAWAATKQAQEPSSITEWNTTDSFQLTPEDGTERHVYLKVVDNAGNVAYFRANTILFDTTKPSITGVKNGATYYTTQTAAVSDDYLDAVTLNGAAVTLNEDGKTASVKLTGNVEKTYILKATDKAGNETTVTVIMKPISSITDPVKDLTKDNVTEDDRKTLDELTGILEDLLEPTTDQTEKQKLQDELDKLEELLDVLDEVKEVEELLRDLPDDVEPDVDADTEQKIKDARKALDDLTDHQEDLVEDDLIEKLERLEKELVDYKIEGGSTWNRGSGKALRLVGNGRLDKLDKVILDGTELTTGFTKSTPKTTIDLQAAFLQSLELGEHTLKLVYTDGEAEAKFTVKQSPNYLDLTGNPDFDDQTEVDVGGERYPIEEIGGRYVNLPESGDLLTTYTYLAGNAAGTHDNYPIGMRVFRINRSEDGTTVTEITEFADLLQYSGCSIRVSGKRGIRMITSMTKANKSALKGKGLAGFTMLEYGTVVQWADTLGSDDLTLNSGNHNYAYKRGVADPVFGTSGGLTQYTNVLVGFDLEECSKDIVMRPYIILQDADGNQYTLYGGLVTRSISYIAWQNRDTYKPGTAAYKYVHELMGDLDTPAEGG
ncbi:MAG: YDG domain-containing protein [Firmicutes bacterium]|nr:YDG domain-containing protein [Bacillota bacterium]MDY6160427.1 YDG domain-containing protein [Candidatus Faecousia sp.]